MNESVKKLLAKSLMGEMVMLQEKMLNFCETAKKNPEVSWGSGSRVSWGPGFGFLTLSSLHMVILVCVTHISVPQPSPFLPPFSSFPPSFQMATNPDYVESKFPGVPAAELAKMKAWGFVQLERVTKLEKGYKLSKTNAKVGNTTRGENTTRRGERENDFPAP